MGVGGMGGEGRAGIGEGDGREGINLHTDSLE